MENYQIFVTFNPLVFSLYRQGLHSRAADNLPNLSWFNRTLYRMLKTQPKQALRVLLKTVEMVNKSFALLHFELVYINMTSATLSPASHCLSANVVTLKSRNALADQSPEWNVGILCFSKPIQMSYLLPLHSYNVCQIMFTLHVYGMTFTMGGEQEGRWRLQLREMAAKPETSAV